MMSEARTIRRKMNSDVEAAKATTVVKVDTANRTPHVSLSEQIAGSRVCLYNWRWKGADEDFPREPWMRVTRKYYPDAQGGPLAVDEPAFKHELMACERKAKALKVRGIRYLILRPEMTLVDAMGELHGLDNGEHGTPNSDR